VVNTNDHPVRHQLEESAPSSGVQFYLWGGSDLKPGQSFLHVYVTYERDRGYWNFRGFARREN
jgi:hypothetical protein